MDFPGSQPTDYDPCTLANVNLFSSNQLISIVKLIISIQDTAAQLYIDRPTLSSLISLMELLSLLLRLSLQ